MDFNEAQTMITARQQGAAPDRLQLRSLRSCLAAVSALPAAGELGRSAAKLCINNTMPCFTMPCLLN